MLKRSTVILAFLLIPALSYADPSPRELAVEVYATVSGDDLILHWPYHEASGYSVARKRLDDAAWTPLASLPGSATSYRDRLGSGSAFEYQVIRSGSLTATGYLYGGIDVPPVDHRGTILLVVASRYANALAAELTLLEKDLAGDGWTVTRINVDEQESPARVRELLRTEYFKNPSQVRAALLFGHVPVARSGNLAPDGHPDHYGAWAADTYYADLDGAWTDDSVTATSAAKSFDHNVPGDGKFDQSEIPSDVELEVGRVDLSNLTCFSNKVPARDELTLLRQYLRKNHRYRWGEITLERRGVISDNFGWHDGDAFSAGAYRTFPALFGRDSASTVGFGAFFPTLNAHGYLWSFGAGGGDWVSCAGIGDANDFALNDPRSVFTAFIGSYFGDWDHESNFMRAVLGASSYTLTTAWAGRPAWFFHHMGLGREIGYSAKISQNNSGRYAPAVRGSRGVHVSLLGDPTLRTHVVAPPSNVMADAAGLHWNPSPDTSVIGYHVYRAATANGPYVRLTSAPVTGNSYPGAADGAHYLVKALKLERSGSGSYYNTSQGAAPSSGVSISSNGGSQTAVIAPPSDPSVFFADGEGLVLRWKDNSSNEAGFSIEREEKNRAWVQVGVVNMNATRFVDGKIRRGVNYAYRVQAFAGNSASIYSPEAWGAVPEKKPGTPQAAIVSLDRDTQGNWSPRYGNNGVVIPFFQDTLDGLIRSTRPRQGWIWEYETPDAHALRYNSGGRAVTYYDEDEIVLDVQAVGRGERMLSLYLLDWDNLGREMELRVMGAETVLATERISDFSRGVYASIVLSGVTQIRLKRVQGPNAVVSGLFTDTPTKAMSRKARKLRLMERRKRLAEERRQRREQARGSRR